MRYGHDGSITVIAESFQGKRLNSPNDVVRASRTAASGSPIRRTAGSCTKGQADASGGRANLAGRLNPRAGQAGGHRQFKRNCRRACTASSVGRLDLVVTEDQVPDPNGITFRLISRSCTSPAQERDRATPDAGGKGEIYAFDVGADNKRRIGSCSGFTIDGVKCGPDGLRCDVEGNVWASSNAGRAVGYSGATVWSPAGKLLGRIRLRRSAAISRSAD